MEDSAGTNNPPGTDSDTSGEKEDDEEAGGPDNEGEVDRQAEQQDVGVTSPGWEIVSPRMSQHASPAASVRASPRRGGRARNPPAYLTRKSWNTDLTGKGIRIRFKRKPKQDQATRKPEAEAASNAKAETARKARGKRKRKADEQEAGNEAEQTGSEGAGPSTGKRRKGARKAAEETE